MNISEAAKLSGLPAKTIRYYESINLLSPPRRAANGYRRYAQADIDILCFLRHDSLVLILTSVGFCWVCIRILSAAVLKFTSW